MNGHAEQTTLAAEVDTVRDVHENRCCRHRRAIGENAHLSALLDDKPAAAVARRLKHGNRAAESRQAGEHPLQREPCAAA